MWAPLAVASAVGPFRLTLIIATTIIILWAVLRAAIALLQTQEAFVVTKARQADA